MPVQTICLTGLLAAPKHDNHISTGRMISHLLLILGAGVLSAALRSFQHPVLFRLGTLGVVATSFLAGWLLGDSLALGAALAASWLFLPWLEILTRVRRLRLPAERDLGRRSPPTRHSFPDLQEMTEEIEAEGFEHLEDIGWEHEDHRHFYRVFHDSSARLQASICLSEQEEIAFCYVTVVSRVSDGRVLMTWNYPFSYSLKLQPRLTIHRFADTGPFNALLAEHRKLLTGSGVETSALLDPTPEETIHAMQNEMRAQIIHNIDIGLLERDGNNLIRYTVRGMFYLWFQFLRDLVRLS